MLHLDMGNPRLTLSGMRFGFATVLRPRGSDKKKSFWECVCDCGNVFVTKGVYLKRGATRSCGCLVGENNKKHGGVGTPEYRSWVAMRNRCFNKKNHAYKRYGGRGIKVASRWGNFENFLSDMGKRPIGTSLDRIDNDGDYKPSNCRWATRKQQGTNKRNNKIISFFGKMLTLKDASDHFQIKRTTLSRRLNAGWSIRDALTRPVRAKGGVT